jgi:hypothetical protein
MFEINGHTGLAYFNGNVLIGGTALPLNRKISIEGNITGGTTAYGIDQFVTISSGVTTSMFGYRSNPSTAAAAFTLPDLYHFYANDVAIGAGSAVTRQYGFFSNIASGTGDWNLYMGGTAANYMNGNLLIGTTTDAGFKLDVNGTARIVGAVTTNSSSGFRLDSAGSILFSLGYSGGTLLDRLTGTAIRIAENGTPQLTIATGGAATFSSSVTASSLIKSGGTSSQFLKADGSVDSNTYQTTITLTTIGTSGAATLVGSTLNIPNYADTDTGITSLNGLTALTQTFAVGTSGTDFGISSASSTHTFNLPTASATNRGALSSADWTTFNNKQNALTNPITGTGSTNNLPKFTGSTALGNSNLVNDTIGNLGLGITPVNSYTPSLSLEIGANGILWSEKATSSFNSIFIGLNSYFNSAGNPLYKNTGLLASRYTQSQGSHIWDTAPSGTANGAITFATNMRLDANGQLGLGVTPSAWSGFKALQTVGGSLIGAAGELQLWQNAYYDGASKYYATGTATRYGMTAGQHRWYYAVSGTANAALTWVQAMTLDASGRLGIGITSPLGKLQVVLPTYTNEDTDSQQAIFGSGTNGYGVRIGYSESGNYGVINSIKPAVAWGNLVLQSGGGNVLIGTTTNSSYKLDVNGTARVSGKLTVDNNSGISILASTNFGMNMYFDNATGYSYIDSKYDSAGSGRLYIRTRTNGTPVNALMFLGTGAATFSSSVTATNFIVPGGTSAQFLKADGSLDSNVYLTSTSSTFSYTASVTLSPTWQNTGVSSANLGTGVYLVTCNANDFGVGGLQYNCTYTGLMYFFAGATNGSDANEIVLHHTGHADNGRYIYLRTLNTVSADGKTYLQISGNGTNSAASNYQLTFKKLL